MRQMKQGKHKFQLQLPVYGADIPWQIVLAGSSVMYDILSCTKLSNIVHAKRIVM